MFCPWGAISQCCQGQPGFLPLIVQRTWGKEQVLQRGHECLGAIETNCGINSQWFQNRLHSLSFVMCNGRPAPIFTCRRSQSNKEVGWKFLFICSKVTGCWAIFFFLVVETITLFIENKCWHLEGAAAGEGKKHRERARERGRAPVFLGECLWCYLTTGPESPGESTWEWSVHFNKSTPNESVWGEKEEEAGLGAVRSTTCIGGCQWR